MSLNLSIVDTSSHTNTFNKAHISITHTHTHVHSYENEKLWKFFTHSARARQKITHNEAEKEEKKIRAKIFRWVWTLQFHLPLYSIIRYAKMLWLIEWTSQNGTKYLCIAFNSASPLCRSYTRARPTRVCVFFFLFWSRKIK